MRSFAARLIAALSLILLACPAQAAPVAGDNEIEASAGLFHAQGSDSGALTADLSFGKYLTPGWNAGLRQGLNYTFIDDARDHWVATTTPFLNYHFRLSDTVLPFLGAFIGAVWNDQDITGTLGPAAGVKFFVHDQTYLGLRYRYEWFFDSLKAAANNRDDGNHVVTLGIGFVWGGASRPSR
jgi:opacity protein-like surface antigen